MNRRRRLILQRRTAWHCPNAFDKLVQPLSVARPVANRPSTATYPSFPLRRAIDSPLSSPTAAETSVAESIDGAPSPLCDRSSAFSASQRLTISPSIKLPPLASINQNERRPSLPTPQSMPNTFFSKARNQAQSFTLRFYSDSEVHGLSAISPMCRRPEQHSILPPLHLDLPTYSRRQGHTCPSTPIQLPPL
jgi:hypothetical protein